MPSWVSDSGIFFITVCAVPRECNHLCHTDCAEKLFESVEFNRGRGVWWPHLVLLMPDHLHGLFSFAPSPGMKKALGDWKHYTSRILNVSWQRDFFDHRLRPGESFREKAAYIRENPVRAGLVNRGEDWAYVRAWPVRLD
jgi:REP element-mobilizing transposase RayT